MNIPISTAKDMREMVGAEQIVIVAVRDGVTCVATHGLTERDADEAAKGGNALKKYLGWPADKCDAKPLPRICANCVYYKPDYGMWCFNGWSGDGSNGHCLVEPAVTRIGKEHGCRHFEPKN